MEARIQLSAGVGDGYLPFRPLRPLLLKRKGREMQHSKELLWWVFVGVLLFFASGALVMFLDGMYHLAFGG